MQVHESLIDLIGNTPLVRLRKVTRHLGSGHSRGHGSEYQAGPGDAPMVLAKVEYMSPGGSVKDRIALRMVEAAEASGALRPGGTIVEPTSGNTGVGLAIVAAEKGYKCVFVCPDKVAPDKISVLRAYGADVVVCPTTVSPDSPDSYYSVSDRLASEIPGGWKPNQYANPANPESHYLTTGPEIWEQTEGKVTHFVAGIGTGGTISGTGRYLKEVSGGRVRVIGADPEGSVYSGGTGRPYLVEGVGEDFWPDTYDKGICDQIIAVSDADSFQMTRRLAAEEALLVGGSCGMAVVAALKVAEHAGPDDVIVVLLPDGGPRLPLQGVQRRLDGRLRLPDLGDRRAEDRRRARSQARPVAALRARASGRDGTGGDRDAARVRRLAAPRAEGGASGDGGRGDRLDHRAGTARRAGDRAGRAWRAHLRPHVGAAADDRVRRGRSAPRSPRWRRPARRWFWWTGSRRE